MSLPHDITTQEYIEVIRDLEKKNKVARVKDIALSRGVSKSSVSLVLNQLVKKELIDHEHYSHVTLTDTGNKLASDLETRHQTIKSFLIHLLGLPEDVAETDACKFEHEISNETLKAIRGFILFTKNCPREDLVGKLERFKDCSVYGTGTQCNCKENADKK